MNITLQMRLFSPVLLLVFLIDAGDVAQAQEHEFCWKSSYGRGVGTTPSSCAPGQEMIGLLCYDKCGPGMARFGFDCHSVCPAGMDNQGLFCRRSEYGRGGGYPWQPQDAFSDSGMKERCERVHGRGNCEKDGLIFYPKCKPGYSAFGCCICRPNVPNCAALGLNPGIDLSCAKKVAVGSPKTGICAPGQEEDVGLCYSNCKPGHDGVGPVCWENKPAGWVNCGMGAAKDSATCGQIVFDQVSSVGQMAIFVASLGSSSAGSAAVSGAKSATKLARLKKEFAAMKQAWNRIKNVPEVKKAILAAETADLIKQGYDISQEAENAVTEEDMVRIAAQIAAIVDPTGVAGTIAAYTYPQCSKYFPNRGAGSGTGTGTQGQGSTSLTNVQVNGRNVVRADFGQGGSFRRSANGGWSEYDAAGRAVFNFSETARDDWSVYLNDGSRNVQIQIDLYRKMISYGTNHQQRTDLYPVTASWKPGTSATTNAGSLSQDQVNGRNVVRADFGQGGSFRRSANGGWSEYDAAGRAVFNFSETARDDWSVYLNDGSRNVQIQIDLYRKMISYGTYNQQRSDLYPITSAWR